MRISNKTKKTLLTKDAKVASTLMDSLLGLTQYTTPKAMLFTTRFGIHTFGMHYPIDILILDQKDKVVALKEELRPNRIFLWKPIYSRVLELPPGTIHNTQTELLDTLSISSEQ